MICPDFASQVSGNPDKTDRTDTRARIGNRTLSGVRFPSAFALSVSGSASAQKVSIHGTACLLTRTGGGVRRE